MKNLLRGANLHNLAFIHNRNTVPQLEGFFQIMTDEKNRAIQLFLMVQPTSEKVACSQAADAEPRLAPNKPALTQADMMDLRIISNSQKLFFQVMRCSFKL